MTDLVSRRDVFRFFGAVGGAAVAASVPALVEVAVPALAPVLEPIATVSATPAAVAARGVMTLSTFDAFLKEAYSDEFVEKLIEGEREPWKV